MRSQQLGTRNHCFEKTGILIAIIALNSLSAEMIFHENFDDQPDWHSAMHSTDRSQYASSHTIPDNWYSVRQGPTWAPSTGHTDRHEAVEILASNAHKARGGTGKSFVSWRDSYDPGWRRWNSESTMSYVISDQPDEGLDEIYVEFWIAFSPEWTFRGSSKLFKIFSWNGENIHNHFGGGDSGPAVVWDYSYSSYGVRNRLSFRGGPHGENYGMSDTEFGDLNRSLSGSGDFSGNFSGNMVNSTYGTDPEIPDKLNGGYLPKSGTIEHRQVFGEGGQYTKVGIYLKMNSAPGVQDGIYKQFLDDQLIMESNKVTWVDSNTDNKMVKWNVVGIGGNDFFQSYPNEERVEEWYSIDDLKIYSKMPTSPQGPSNVTYIKQ